MKWLRMSHELRTPLNAILGYAELMADGAYGEPSEKMLGILKRLLLTHSGHSRSKFAVTHKTAPGRFQCASLNRHDALS
jgi:signal transduction histidine kinase